MYVSREKPGSQNIGTHQLREAIMFHVRNICTKTIIVDYSTCHTFTRHTKYSQQTRVNVIRITVGILRAGYDSTEDIFTAGGKQRAPCPTTAIIVEKAPH